MKNELEIIRIKVFNYLKAKAKYKYLNFEIDLLKNAIIFKFNYDIYLEFTEKYIIYYCKDDINFNNQNIYLNFENTRQEFDTLEDAIYYVEYLELLFNSKQLEQYFYFERKAKISRLPIFQKFSLSMTGNLDLDYFFRIEVNSCNYSILLCFGSTYIFELQCTPNDYNWIKNKRKIYENIDDLESFTDSYDSIKFDEKERDMF